MGKQAHSTHERVVGIVVAKRVITSSRGAPGLALILARDPVEEQWRLRRGQRLPAEQRVSEYGVGVAAQLAALSGLGLE